MTIEGVDYSFARPGGARLAAAGKRFAVRYLHRSGKGLTNSEIADLKNHGIAVAVVYEENARSFTGFNAGVQQSRSAQTLLNGLSLDHNLPIYFAVDWDVQPNEMAGVHEALRGAASVIGLGRVGLYGSYSALASARASGRVTWLWQTYAWSGGRVLPGIHLYQYSNGQWSGSVDFTRAYAENYGQKPGNGDDDMPSAQEVAEAVLNYAVPRQGSGLGGTTTIGATIAWLDGTLGKLLSNTEPATIINALLDAPIEQQGRGKELGDYTTLRNILGWSDNATITILTAIGEAQAAGADVDKIKAAVAEAISSIQVKVVAK